VLYKIISDFVIFIHFLWIGFVILGFPVFLWLNNAKWRIIHLLVVTGTILMQSTRTICPLTYMEAFLKFQDTDRSVYPGSFIIEHVERLIYVENLTLEKISCATIIYFVMIVASFWFRPIRAKRQDNL
jgi:hypothetical protein